MALPELMFAAGQRVGLSSPFTEPRRVEARSPDPEPQLSETSWIHLNHISHDVIPTLSHDIRVLTTERATVAETR